MFVFRARIFPTLGKAAEYRAATEAWVKTAHAQGYIVSFARQHFGTDGETSFTVSIKFKDLAEYERVIHQIEASADFQAYVSKASGLNRAAPRYELYEVLVPYPR